MAGESEHHTPDGNMDQKSETSSRLVSSSTPEASEPTAPGRHLLGVHVVGQRVVVRRVVPGETGPTGGPAFTDTLGVCVSWADGVCALQREDGSVMRIAVSEIVSGKPVPPRPSVRLRVSAAEAEAHVAALWPDCEVTELGGWSLRTTPPGADGRLRKRGNSLLAIDALAPGRSAAQVADLAVAHYRQLGQPALAATALDSEGEAALLGLGWQPLAEGASTMLVAPVSRAVRLAGRAATPVDLVDGEHDAVARVVLGEREVARGRAVLTGGDWVGIEDLWVAPEHRRGGLARAVLADLLDWAASRGALTTWLHVELGNEAAWGLYERLGFSEHHQMGYLAPPSA